MVNYTLVKLFRKRRKKNLHEKCAPRTTNSEGLMWMCFHCGSCELGPSLSLTPFCTEPSRRCPCPGCPHPVCCPSVAWAHLSPRGRCEEAFGETLGLLALGQVHLWLVFTVRLLTQSRPCPGIRGLHPCPITDTRGSGESQIVAAPPTSLPAPRGPWRMFRGEARRKHRKPPKEVFQEEGTDGAGEGESRSTGKHPFPAGLWAVGCAGD